jgi:hypothetical protein
MGCPMVKGGELPGLLRLRARDSRRSKARFLGWNRGQAQLLEEWLACDHIEILNDCRTWEYSFEGVL